MPDEVIREYDKDLNITSWSCPHCGNELQDENIDDEECFYCNKPISWE